ncbi:MAG: hypothetical protein ACE5I8_05645, partial [Thermodesulfobacteriota bacterium]
RRAPPQFSFHCAQFLPNRLRNRVNLPGYFFRQGAKVKRPQIVVDLVKTPSSPFKGKEEFFKCFN